MNMAANEIRAVGHRIRRLREQRGMDRGELARQVDVHSGSIARWETGGALPHAYTLERIAEVLGAPVEFILTGQNVASEADDVPNEVHASNGSAAPGGDDDGAGEVLFSLDRVARFLEGIAPAGEERLRKLDALEGLRRMLTARGVLPGWWYALHERVERGEA